MQGNNTQMSEQEMIALQINQLGKKVDILTKKVEDLTELLKLVAVTIGKEKTDINFSEQKGQLDPTGGFGENLNSNSESYGQLDPTGGFGEQLNSNSESYGQLDPTGGFTK